RTRRATSVPESGEPRYPTRFHGRARYRPRLSARRGEGQAGRGLQHRFRYRAAAARPGGAPAGDDAGDHHARGRCQPAARCRGRRLSLRLAPLPAAHGLAAENLARSHAARHARVLARLRATCRLMARHVVILAGGSGTRLWPRSREKSPKHLLALAGRLSLLQSTFERVRRLTENVYVVTERSQVDSIREQ